MIGLHTTIELDQKDFTTLEMASRMGMTTMTGFCNDVVKKALQDWRNRNL